jgi:N-acetylneuraminic acid mutarotase
MNMYECIYTYIHKTRYLHSAAMSQGLMIVFAGEHIEPLNKKKTNHKLNDVWSYSLEENAWTQLTVDDCDVIFKICA